MKHLDRVAPFAARTPCGEGDVCADTFDAF